MFRLSKKADYAMILLSHLSKKMEPVSAQEVSSTYHMPASMVANIFKKLATEGLVHSKRGQSGGYYLARSPSEISMSDVVKAIDQPFNLVDCIESHSPCNVSVTCPTKNPLNKVNQKIDALLESVTLESIVSGEFSDQNTECCK